MVIEKAHCRCQNQRQRQTTVTNPETRTDDAKNDWSPTSPSSYRHKPLNHHLLQLCLFHSFPRWWFHFFNVHPYLGKVSNLTSICLEMETTNDRQANLCCWWKFQSNGAPAPWRGFGVVYIRFIAGKSWNNPYIWRHHRAWNYGNVVCNFEVFASMKHRCIVWVLKCNDLCNKAAHATGKGI